MKRNGRVFVRIRRKLEVEVEEERLKHLRKAEDTILVMLGLNPVGGGTG